MLGQPGRRSLLRSSASAGSSPAPGGTPLHLVQNADHVEARSHANPVRRSSSNLRGARSSPAPGGAPPGSGAERADLVDALGHATRSPYLFLIVSGADRNPVPQDPPPRGHASCRSGRGNREVPTIPEPFEDLQRALVSSPAPGGTPPATRAACRSGRGFLATPSRSPISSLPSASAGTYSSAWGYSPLAVMQVADLVEGAATFHDPSPSNALGACS